MGTTAISAILFLLVAIATATVPVPKSAKKCEKRDVQVILFPPSSPEKYFFSRVHSKSFFKELRANNDLNGCWNLNSIVIDTEAVQVDQKGDWTQTPGHNSTIKFKEYLEQLRDEYKKNTDPDLPKRVLLLVFGGVPDMKSLKALVKISKEIQETNTDIVVVTVDLFDPLGEQTEQFQEISKRDVRYRSVDSFEKLKSEENFVIIRNLLDKPDPPPVRLGSYSDSVDPNKVDERFVTKEYKDINPCKQPVDIAFVIDGSGSLEDEYHKEKEFVIGLAKAFQISQSPNQARAGVIQFSKKASLSIKLNEHHNAESFGDAVDALQSGFLTTYIDKALIIARDEFFKEKNGGRRGVKKLVIVVTDGSQTKTKRYTEPGTIANEIREKLKDTWKVQDGKNCSTGRITDASTCKKAARHLGLTWESTWHGPKDAPGCVQKNDGRGTVWFNTANTNVLTHHYDTNPKHAEICDIGVGILAIGVGNDTAIDQSAMVRIAGSEKDVRRAESMDHLRSKQFVQHITYKACENINKVKYCEQQVDIVFLFDASGSIDVDKHYAKMKEFTLRVADKFGISKTGAHAGLVVFSDEGKRKMYSKIEFQLDDNTTPKKFRRAVKDAHYYGYRTRIDLGFKLAKEVFQGGRPNVKKVIILLTDGKQNPVGNDRDIPDPVTVSAELYNNNVSIYAVGIGHTINYNQLVRITRKKHRVFHTANFDILESMDFVNKVSETTCHHGTRPTVPPATIKEDCKPTSKPCGGGCSVIFNLNVGTTYVVSGAQLSKDGKSLSVSCAADRCKTQPMNNMNIEQLIKVIKTALNGMCNGNGCKNTVKTVRRAPEIINNRKRRSIDSDPVAEKLSVMRQLSRTAGCNMFMQTLKKNGFMARISKLMKTGHHVAVFCPVDTAYARILSNSLPSDQEEKIILNHIGIKHDKFATMYRTLAGGKIIFNAVGKQDGASKWRANGADVIISVQDGVNSEIVILNDVILPTSQVGILNALKKNPDVSIFYNLLTAVGYDDVFSPTSSIDKICFTNDTCVSLTPTMVRHLKYAVEFNHFTVVAPTNEMFRSFYKDIWNTRGGNDMRQWRSSNQLKEFLRRHVYLGSLGNPDSKKEIAYSLSARHNVMMTTTATTKGGKMATVLVDSQGNELRLNSAVAVKEGMLLIVDAPAA